MYVQATFKFKGTPAFQVPASALLFRSSGPQVAVVDENGAVAFRDVTIASDDGNVVSMGSGLHAGDRVALNLCSQIVAGAKVTAKGATERRRRHFHLDKISAIVGVCQGRGFACMRLSGSCAALAAAGALAGCAVGPDYHMPVVRTPAAFVAEAAAGSSHASRRTEVDLRQWWRSLHDKELDSLVDRALTSNFDLAIALARIQAAREQIIVVAGAALPEVTISAGGGGGTGSDETRGRASPEFRSAENAKNLNSIGEAGGFAAGWDLDLFGRVKRQVEAATDEAEALKDARDWIYVTVAADVARAYLDMRAQQQELAVLGQNIDAARASLNLAQSRLDRGLTNELDVSLAKRELGTLEAEQGPLRAQIEASRHAIAVLLGQYPETLAMELAAAGPPPSCLSMYPSASPPTFCAGARIFSRRSGSWRRRTPISARRSPICFRTSS